MPNDNFALDTDRNKLIVDDTIQRLGDLLTDRAALNAQCEEIAQLILPSHVSSFFSPGLTRPYVKKNDQQVDSNGMVANSRFTAICDSMMTPQGSTWHIMEPGGPHRKELMKDRASKMWFYDLTQSLFQDRYSPLSNFVGQNQAIWTSLGAFGNGFLFVDDYYDLNKRIKANRYMAIPFGSIYFEFNHQGQVDGFIRIMQLKARQAVKHPDLKDRIPEQVRTAASKTPMREFTFLHRVCPRDDYKPWMYDSKNMPYASYFICVETRELMSEGGYRTFPGAATHYENAPGEENGRSPAMMVLPALRTLNAEKADFLRQGHRAVAPVLLIADDGIMNMNLKPGAQNRGGWSSDGKPLVGVLPHGEIQISEEMMQMEVKLIEDVFLVELFRIAEERKSGTTATEVIDEINKRGIIVAPTMGRQQGYLARVIDREIALKGLRGQIPPMPGLLREAAGEYNVVYTSPLAKAMRSGEVLGFMRSVETSKEIMNVTGDQSVMDPYDFDAATPEMAYINGAPEPWMAGPDKIAAKRQARAQAAQAAAAPDQAKGAAAMLSATAKAKQAGMAGVAPATRDLTNGAPPAA